MAAIIVEDRLLKILLEKADKSDKSVDEEANILLEIGLEQAEILEEKQKEEPAKERLRKTKVLNKHLDQLPPEEVKSLEEAFLDSLHNEETDFLADRFSNTLPRPWFHRHFEAFTDDFWREKGVDFSAR